MMSDGFKSSWLYHNGVDFEKISRLLWLESSRAKPFEDTVNVSEKSVPAKPVQSSSFPVLLELPLPSGHFH